MLESSGNKSSTNVTKAGPQLASIYRTPQIPGKTRTRNNNKSFDLSTPHKPVILRTILLLYSLELNWSYVYSINF